MRFRPVAALSAFALAAVLLSGCTATEAEPDATGNTDLCGAKLASGESSDAVTAEGTVGEIPTVAFETPLEIDAVESTQLVEGDGEQLQAGDYVELAFTGVDAATGEVLGSVGYDGDFQPEQVAPDGSLGQFVGCATVGSRFAITLPAADTTTAQVYIMDVLSTTPADEWCAVEEPGDAFPTVEFDADGKPTVTIPDAEAPSDVELEVLVEGDGDTVETGDNVTVDYHGVKWSDGSVFDSSYDRGEPAEFNTTAVVTGFQRALEGQKVGSTVVVSMPPACGYGTSTAASNGLGGETLVFVVEILDTARTGGE